jgi:outer membrane lipoprotein SlyB
VSVFGIPLEAAIVAALIGFVGAIVGAIVGQVLGAVLGSRYSANVTRRTQLELAELARC